MIERPRKIEPYAKRDRDCEKAIREDFLDAVHCLERHGQLRDAVAAAFLRALNDQSSDTVLCEILDYIREWAVHAGWEPGEVNRALYRLIFNYAETPNLDENTGRVAIEIQHAFSM